MFDIPAEMITYSSREREAQWVWKGMPYWGNQGLGEEAACKLERKSSSTENGQIPKPAQIALSFTKTRKQLKQNCAISKWAADWDRPNREGKRASGGKPSTGSSPTD